MQQSPEKRNQRDRDAEILRSEDHERLGHAEEVEEGDRDDGGRYGAVHGGRRRYRRGCLRRSYRPLPPPPVAHRPHRQYHHKRSEEHTSELQSHVNLVCRLLLEKKKKRM